MLKYASMPLSGTTSMAHYNSRPWDKLVKGHLRFYTVDSISRDSSDIHIYVVYITKTKNLRADKLFRSCS